MVPLRKIYEHIEFARVGYFQSILEAQGIPTHIKNLGASAASGEVPFMQVYPELWVVNDWEYERALQVLKPYYEVELPEGEPWECPACGADVDGNFGECWQCQRER